MRKLFYVAAFAAVVVLSGCNRKPSTPEAVQALADELNAEMVSRTDGFSYKSVTAEGKDIICDVIVDESMFDGRSLNEALAWYGLTEEVLADQLKDKFFSLRIVTEKAVRRFQTMHENECDFVFRFHGSESGDLFEVVLSHEDLPEANMEEVEAMRAKFAGVPDEVVEFIGAFETRFFMTSEIGISYGGSSMEGNDIVFVIVLDEEALEFDNFKETFEQNGVTQEMMHDELLRSVYEAATQKASDEFDVLRDNQYNIVVRYVGSKSHAMMQARLSYDELPNDK